MDFFELGALNRYLHDPNAKKFTWKYRVKVALDIAKGMLYLHNEDIIHRDLRSPNILVSSLSDTADVVVKGTSNTRKSRKHCTLTYFLTVDFSGRFWHVGNLCPTYGWR